VGKILDDMQAPKTIDYLSLDVEGSEHMILQSFPFFTPTASPEFDHYQHTPRTSAGGGGGYRVLVVSIEHPDLCSRTVLRRQGFHFLASLQGQDEVWVHESLPDLAGVLAEMGGPEPLERRAEQRKTLQTSCRRLTSALARDSLNALRIQKKM